MEQVYNFQLRAKPEQEVWIIKAHFDRPEKYHVHHGEVSYITLNYLGAAYYIDCDEGFIQAVHDSTQFGVTVFFNESEAKEACERLNKEEI